MAKPSGFMEYDRENLGHRPVDERVKDYAEIDLPLGEEALRNQAARCMDCGIPFCHGYGCPVKNRMPEFNDLVYRGKWREASENLHSTNNFPEFTGRVCPAPCEPACTLSINDEPVTIKHIEYQIVERAWSQGWIVPLPPAKKTGKRVAVIGSGPAGLATAQQLARAGHEVVVFEKDDRLGGLLRYGIPDFKLDKRVIDRRLAQMRAEGVQFQTGVHVGRDISVHYLRLMFDAVCLTMGAGEPRDLAVPGRQGAQNVLFALDFLCQQNRRLAGDVIDHASALSAKDKVVVVIGGGDTGSDCVGTSRRHGAKEIHQFEILSRPPEELPPDTPWPLWPRILRTSSSHEEGCNRRWNVLTKSLTTEGSRVTGLNGVEVQWERTAAGGMIMKELPGSEFSMKADLILLAMGFVHVVHGGLIEAFGLAMDKRGNVVVENYMTSQPGIFAAGDTTLGASLVVRAITAGREAAAAIDLWLAGH